MTGQIDGEARDVLADRRAVFAEQLAGAMHHPAIDRRHELVALRRGEKLAGRNHFAAVAQHADQQFEARPSVVAAQRQDGLRVEPEAVVAERIAQLADHHDVGVAPDDALIGILEYLDAIAAAVLGRFAGDLRGRQRVRQRIVRAADRRDAEADRHLEGALAGARHDGGRGGADPLGDLRGRFHARVGNERGQAVSRDARRQRRRRQRLRQALRDVDDDVIAHVHAEGLVDDVQPVDIEIQDAVRGRSGEAAEQRRWPAARTRGGS